MVWTRGPASDFDRLAQISGDPGWSWQSLLPMWKEVFFTLSASLLLQPDRGPQVEALVPSPDGHNTTGEIDPLIHGLHGSVEISVQDTTPLDSRVFKTTA